MEQQQLQQHQLQHFIHPYHHHPLLFNPDDDRRGHSCWGCNEPAHGPSYSCKECRKGEGWYTHHKSCAELPLGLHHPLHPIHSLILFPPWRYDDRVVYKCDLCKEYRSQYTYRCSRCDFNLHITCASLEPIKEPEFHDHSLTCFWKWITFNCDLCGKEDKGVLFILLDTTFQVMVKTTKFSRSVPKKLYPLHYTFTENYLRGTTRQYLKHAPRQNCFILL